jgi:hypothetical protein
MYKMMDEYLLYSAGKEIGIDYEDTLILGFMYCQNVGYDLEIFGEDKATSMDNI